jgi:hypothetical protein
MLNSGSPPRPTRRASAWVLPLLAGVLRHRNQTIVAQPERPGPVAPREEAMPDEPKPDAQRSYQMGNVGAGARVAQGENISWLEGVASLPDGESLTRQFDALLKRIAADGSLDEDTRALAQGKTKAVAEGMAKVQESPTALRRALLDAKSWFGVTASWVGSALGDILKSEAAQKTLGTVTEATTKAAIASFVS